MISPDPSGEGDVVASISELPQPEQDAEVTTREP